MDESPASIPTAASSTDGDAEEKLATEIIQGYSDEFDKRCQERHDMGEKKYGAGTWMTVDTLEMAIEEIIDLANYARFSFVRLRAMQELLGTDKSTEKPLEGMAMLGKDAFISSQQRG